MEIGKNNDIEDFLRAAKIVLGFEGGFVDHPNDSGGPTKYGITLMTLKRLKMDLNGDGKIDAEDVKLITKKKATEIYYQHYWRAAGCHNLDWPMNVLVFDRAVNTGVRRALSMLSKYKDPCRYLLGGIEYYVSLANRRKKYRDFLRGWINRLVRLGKIIGVLV